MPVSLYAVTLDCADASELADFWSEALGRPVDDGATTEFAAIGLADPPGPQAVWMFHQVPEGKTAKNRFHPDLVTPDLDGEVKRLIDLGATRQGDYDESGAQWVTLTDPAGNEFDVVAVEG
ncbi:MAG TPA: VOC family protein [Streptosporangiaceae bacterium]|jgi:catechol-2,3-dioxygenase|nr:VOC family protein [Streptosporangiaceae bacterium]